MGTDYNLNSSKKYDLSISEMSCRFDLTVYDKKRDVVLTLLEDIEPYDMMKILLDGIKVCSYYMEKEEFKDTLSKLEDYSF